MEERRRPPADRRRMGLSEALEDTRAELANLRTDTNALREAVLGRVSHSDLEQRIATLRTDLTAEQEKRRRQLADYEANLRRRRFVVRRRWIIGVAVLVALSVWGSQVRRARDAARVEDAIERERVVAVQACEDRRELAVIVAGIFGSSTTTDEERREQLDDAAAALLDITETPC